jgi:hypothetical protein
VGFLHVENAEIGSAAGSAHRHFAIFGRGRVHAQGFAGLDGAEKKWIKFISCA